MSSVWLPVWETDHHDDLRLRRSVGTGRVKAVAAGGAEHRPLVVAVVGEGDRLWAWDVVADAVTTVPVSGARCVTFADTLHGSVVVTGHTDGMVRAWSIPDLQELRSWQAGGQELDDVWVGAAVVVTLDADGVVARWSLADGEPLGVLGGSPSFAFCGGRLVAGRSVLAVAGDGLSLWDVSSGEQLPLPVLDQGSLGDIPALVLWTRAGRDLLTVVSDARELITFDVATGGQLHEPIQTRIDDDGDQHVELVVVGRTLAVPTRSQIHLWDVFAATPAGLPLDGPVGEAVVAAVLWEGRDWLVTGSASDGVVGLWDLTLQVHRLREHEERITYLRAAADAVVSADPDGTIIARWARDGSLIAEPTRTGIRGVLSFAAWADGSGVGAANGAGSVAISHRWLHRWDLVEGRELQPAVELTVPLLRHLDVATLNGEPVLVVIDRRRMQLRRVADGSLVEETLLLYPSLVRLVTGGSVDEPVVVVSAEDRSPDVYRLAALADPPSQVPGLDGRCVLAVDGTRVVAGDITGYEPTGRIVRAWSLSGERLGPDVAGEPIVAVAVAGWPFVYVARAGGTVSLTNLETGEDVCSSLHLPIAVGDIAATSDGDLLVAFGTDVARFRPPASRLGVPPASATLASW